MDHRSHFEMNVFRENEESENKDDELTRLTWRGRIEERKVTITRASSIYRTEKHAPQIDSIHDASPWRIEIIPLSVSEKQDL